MSDSITRVFEDIEEYEYLCKKYKEKVQYKNGFPDYSGEHAKELIKREKEEKNKY